MSYGSKQGGYGSEQYYTERRERGLNKPQGGYMLQRRERVNPTGGK